MQPIELGENQAQMKGKKMETEKGRDFGDRSTRKVRVKIHRCRYIM